ncbi:hypothetical protein [Alkaliphilus hydrothermalis]|uniref:Gas vesicle protein n=1 Tax=Alkaliphilus hydrothermalis TaxID=1482730 RepID=A0ABS2NNC4_9FIRM|nr:hypothetical protein [Alkaliphilus hydrothermalis]MBM7614446.1 gas vesicle protein [Alkaliphilus hydrothermalis]
MNLLKPLASQNFILGIGIAAATYVFGPAIKRGAKKVAVKGVQGALMAGEATNETVSKGKDMFSDFMNNVHHNENSEQKHMEQLFQQELFNSLKTTQENQSKAFTELLSTIKDMQEEIRDFKKTMQSNSNPEPQNM